MSFERVACVTVALLAAATSCRLAPEPAVVAPIVRDGSVDLRFMPLGWSEQPGLLAGAEHASPLFAPVKAGTGPVEIEAQLTLARLGHSGASFLVGDSYFGFSGKDDLLFVEGPLFGGGTTHLPIESGIRAGEEFEFKLVRRDGALWCSVDGRKVYERPDAGTALGELALRPHRDHMLLRSWTARGDLLPVDPTPALTEIWRSGEHGYHTYRIPAAVVAPSGDLLVFAEGRVDDRGDSGDIDLVMKRSSDGGRTFSPARVVWDDGSNTCGNPCPVVDTETGTIWLFATNNLGSDRERDIVDGSSDSTRTVWVMASTDNGVTFSEPREITDSAKLASWTWYATGPGAGIRIERGPHAGRLVVPCDHIEAETKAYYSHVLLSDDHGVTWRLGGSSPRAEVNECEVVELADGYLLLNMRSYDRSRRMRQVAFSGDGGETWGGQRADPTLIEPICQASIRRVRWPTARTPGVVLFSNPASPRDRVRMTVRASYDDAASWPEEELLYRGDSAYSCLVVCPDGEVLCVFEADDYRRIVVTRVSVGGDAPLTLSL